VEPSPSEMIRAVIFDLDNTLVDFMAMKRQAIDAAVTAMIDAGLTLSPQDVRRHIDRIYAEMGIEYQQVFDRLLQEVLGRVDYRILSAGVIAYRRAREAALKPYPHVTATLMELVKRRIKLGVVSDAPAREAWLRLCHIGYHHIFDVVITYDDTGERKPSPKPFLLALEQLQVKPSEAIMVGDWVERDIVGAKSVGMLTAFARYGDVFGAQDVGADYILDDITQLLDIVRQHNEVAPQEEPR
jgi:HAD superfamily hydrolase (TIGR02253 family)